MPDNEHVIVGAADVVCVVKLPSPLPDDLDGAHLIGNLPLLGHHGDGIVALVAVTAIPRLRKLGAEVTVIDPDGNSYAARVEISRGSEALVASVEESVANGKAGLAIAQAGGESGKGQA
jgi:hypothetical protein